MDDRLRAVLLDDFKYAFRIANVVFMTSDVAALSDTRKVGSF
jgi:hypothetical protein